RLGRPFNAESLVALLAEIAGDVAAAPAPAAGAADADAPAAAPAPESGTATQAPAAAAATPATPAPPPAAASEPAPAPEPVAEPEPVAATPSTLLDWLTGGSLRGRLRYRRSSGPTLLIDADTPAYHGPSALKPLIQYFEGEVAQADLEPVDDATWQQEVAGAGEPQPLARLIWLGALSSGSGRLLPGHDPEARYTLNRWPQTEREFPRHFRIATAMMKGPATLADIAATSGI